MRTPESVPFSVRQFAISLCLTWLLYLLLYFLFCLTINVDSWLCRFYVNEVEDKVEVRTQEQEHRTTLFAPQNSETYFRSYKVLF